MDGVIARLLDGLTAKENVTNLVIVADQGMASTPASQKVFYDEIIQPDTVRVVTAGVFLSLHVLPGKEAAAEAALLKPHEHIQCWLEQDIPER
jgi:hypothetical protein